MLRIDVADSAHPLREITRGLKRHAPRSGIRAVGVGLRRTGGRHVEGEVVLRVVVRKKREGSRRSIDVRERLPARIRLRSRWLGQPIEVVVPLDLEEAREAKPSLYALRPNATDFLCASAYATWRESGSGRFGLVTAGHGLWNDANHTQPLTQVDVEFDAFCQPRRATALVRAASHLAQHGVDVGLVEVTRPTGLGDFWASAVDIPSAATLIDRLGALGDLLQLPSTFRHFAVPKPHAQSVAYYPTYRIAITGWGLVDLHDVVETEAPSDTFIGGTSGAGLVTVGAGRLALGIQSVCLDPAPIGHGENRRSLATSFFRAEAWLAEHFGRTVSLAWKVP